MKVLKRKHSFIGVFLALAITAVAAFGVFSTFGAAQPAGAAGGEITLVAEVSDVVAGQANPEFTVTLKIENNSGAIGGVEIIVTPLDDNVLVGTADANYVPGGTWSAANGGARIDNEKNVHLIGTDDAGITKNTFTHGGYKFRYNGTPDGAIAFNIALEAVCDDMGDDVAVRYNGQILTADTDTSNLSVAPRTVETTNTLSVLTLSVGGTQIVNGTADAQTAPDPVAYADRGNVKISASRAGAASKIKITDSVGNRVIVNEQIADVSDVSLGNLEVGDHTLTVTVTSESGDAKTYTVTFTVSEEPEAPPTPVAKPSAPATTTGGYNGSPIDFTPSGMAELVSQGKVELFAVSESGAETPVGIEGFQPTNAGSYKVVARPKDGFCWEDDDTADAVYTFTVNKAKLSATPGAEGQLPSVTGDSYTGAVDSFVEFKYYSDAACTQEISKSSLAAGTKYYVKPVLKAGAEANFEFDAGAVTQGIVNSGAEYVTPALPSPSDDGKEKAPVPYWVWIIVGVVALLLIVLLIVLLLVKRNKKDDDTPGKGAQQPVIVNGVDQAAQVEKMEDRMREMEHEAHEREVTRYKEEAERAERKAEQNAPPVVPVPPVAVATDSAAQERVRELEARLREMEKDAREVERSAHDRELARLKEEAEAEKRLADERVRLAEKNAERNTGRGGEPRRGVLYAVPHTRYAGNSGDSERVKELEARLREMEKDAREAERAAHEREIARFKEEAELARRNAEQAQKDPYFGQRLPLHTPPVAGGDAERVKELEARLREMERESHEREIARYKEEAEQAKRAAEERYYAQHPMRNPGYVPYQTNEAQASPYVQKLEEQLRRMEQEAHERELARYRDEAERARKEAEDLSRRSLRQEEELKRLRDLQELEQRSREIVATRVNAPQGRSSDEEMLHRMEMQMMRQNTELQSLTEELERRLAAIQRSKL